MSAPLRRAARREREAAEILGTKRVHRHRFESAPDLPVVTLPNGERIQGEVKTRARLPQVITAAIRQARGYAPDAIPLAIISEKRGEAIACLPLRDLARLLGIEVVPS